MTVDIDHASSEEMSSRMLKFMVALPDRMAANVSTSVQTRDFNGFRTPMTVNDHKSDRVGENCYLVSLYSMYISYAEAELDIVPMPTIVKWVFRALIRFLALLLNFAEIDDCVMINNWILSTNLYPNDSASLDTITEELVSRYPGKYIVFRSLNHNFNSPIIDRLELLGYKKLLSRQVFIFDSKHTRITRSLRNDMQHMKRTRYQYVKHEDFTEQDLKKCLHVYNMLYLNKYSTLNPQYSIEFINACFKSGSYEFHGWRSPETLEIEAFCGTLIQHGIAFNPLFGYNTSLPSEDGLYRLCSLAPMLKAKERNMPMHLSAGAASFKMRRGAKPVMEYSLIYDQHLAFHRRAVVSVLSSLLSIIDWVVSTFGIIM